MDPAAPQYFTMLYGILNLETRDFLYVSAGHPGAIYVSGTAEPVIVETPGFPIGFFKEANYEEHSIPMKPGDRLYLCSDGITEAMNTSRQEFGSARLITALDQSRAMPIQESLSSLLRRVEEWCGAARPEDDISILGFEIAK